MIARLVSLDGHPDIHLGQTVVLVGRHAHCDVRLDSSRVSRRHCCLVLEGDHLVVRDLESTNGTRVNGDLVSVSRMVPGDELSIGLARYRLELGPEPPGASSAIRLDAPPDRPGGGDDPSGLGTWLLDRPPEPGPPRPIPEEDEG
ncbi:FHA domain-containing protein [Tautonia plasticadhaerens]|uniref:Glycogen accumulation regulator GarA n=1 Tax=Tautonia plasticadhaerens TaxID=2527974 RepID=A0A518GVN4_9BACT|nr:FHA domain-containing protein [Tautonia plasticadhaerens]QDV32660.1 Glycogen accumulation regulator GarA [Tautonia plasticadhaerens]